MSLPPLPAWDALHVLIVHFPIALLLLAVPLMLVLALLFPKAGRQFVWSAALLLVVGTALCFLAASTGEAAEELAEEQGVEQDAVIHDALEHHAELGEQTRNIYTVLCLAFLVYLAVPLVLRRQLNPALNAVILAIFLAAHLAAGVQLANTAHEGGLLVHEHGLTAPLAAGAAAGSASQGSMNADDRGGEAGEAADEDDSAE